MNKKIIRTLLNLIPALFFYLSSTAQTPVTGSERMDFVKAEIQRIDKLDGNEDRAIETHDSLRNITAHRAYFVWPDSIDNYIQTGVFNEDDRKLYRDYLFRCLRRVNGSNFRKVNYFNDLFHQLYKEVVAIHEHRLDEVLRQNIRLSLQTCGLYRRDSIAESFLLYAARKEPDEIFRNVDDYANMPYAQHVIDYAAVYAPQTAKKYMLINNPVLDIMKSSRDSVVKIILKITNDYGKKSNAYDLIDAIAGKKLTIRQADSIGARPKSFYKALNAIRSKKDPMGAYSLEKEIEIQALKIVRQINDLHAVKGPKRFESVDDFNPEQLYTLVVYSEEDIFTSTFDGIFKRLKSRLGKQNGFRMIQLTGDNHFRTFIKQCAAFGQLDSFLLTMTPEQRKILMVKFAANLENDDNDISQAVEVADAYTSIKDPIIQMILQQTFSIELQRVSREKNIKGTAIYSILLNLFVSNKLFGAEWYNRVSATYNLPPLFVMPSRLLFEPNKKCIWQIYFYDDEDGDVSFRDFLKTFNDSTWIIEDHDSLYVKISGIGGKLVDIYANRPKAEYTGQAFLENYFDSLDITPDVLVHRGHSYYAYKTIEKTRPGTKIFVMGSCGGYRNLSDIIDKSPNVCIISSKQIGVHTVNNPILRELADNIRDGKDIIWQELWERVDARLKGSIPEIYDKWLDYIPPHKNLGAIFIRAYNKELEEAQ